VRKQKQNAVRSIEYLLVVGTSAVPTINLIIKITERLIETASMDWSVHFIDKLCLVTVGSRSKTLLYFILYCN